MELDKVNRCVDERAKSLKNRLDQLCSGLEHIHGLKDGFKILLDDFVQDLKEEFVNLDGKSFKDDNQNASKSSKKERNGIKPLFSSSSHSKESNDGVENGEETRKSARNLKEEKKRKEESTTLESLNKKRKNSNPSPHAGGDNHQKAAVPSTPTVIFLKPQKEKDQKVKLIPYEPAVDPSFTTWEVSSLLESPSSYSVIALENHSDLENEKLRKSVVSCISQYKNKYEVLYLGKNNLYDKGASEFLVALNGSKSLKYLSLKNNKLKDGCSKEIADVLRSTPLLQLFLNGNDVTSLGLSKWIETIDKLVLLDLGCNELGPSGAKVLANHLKTNNSIVHLYAESNRVGPEGAAYFGEMLKVNKSLSLLYFGGNEIGSKGAQSIAEGMKANKTITKLTIDSNKIGNDGLKYFEGMMKVNKQLTHLALELNDFTVEGVKSLIPHIKNSNLTLIAVWKGKQLTPESEAQKLEIKKLCRSNADRRRKSKE
eukprot:TRINITY_DN7216_c0_g1_i1.p1 TRINITY_DN7216_c0_g1~~TRINITY_DN7216_c0_g1_i1.p1  ORF type:complete len:509 (+),score=183.56 TRINITY_DN7216_c0_g1_i1:76-1527(+)